MRYAPHRSYGADNAEDPTPVVPGDVLATRNTDEVGNDSPGFWNHLAIVVDSGWVVEAQQEPNAVIAVPFDAFVDRYPEIIAFTVVPAGKRHELADIVPGFVGLPYRKPASFFPRWRRPLLGENCVSVVRKAVAKVTGKDPRWRRPDHAVNDSLDVVARKVDYDGWAKPENWFEGMVKSL